MKINLVKSILLTVILTSTSIPSTTFGMNAINIPNTSNTTEINQVDMSTREVTYFYDYTESSYYISEGTPLAVSDELKTSSAGGTLTLTKSKTIGIDWGIINIDAEIKNAIKLGASFALTYSETTAVGYSLGVPPNRTAYMVAVPLYKVSTGTLKKYHGGILRSTQTVTIRSPYKFRYELRFVN